jgi:hypothetical protein
MSTQANRIRSTWPLYLVIATAGAASIATSMSWWYVGHQFEGPRVTLGPDRGEDIVPFTVRFSPQQDWSDIVVLGAVEYEDAAEELRISLVDPGKRTLATQFHTIEGDGRLLFRLEAPATSLRCETAATDPCAQELAVVFGTGGTRTGAYVIDWYLTVETSDDGAEPEDLIFEVDFARGREVSAAPDEVALTAPPDVPGDGRWRLVHTAHGSLQLDPGDTGQSRHITMHGAAPYTASELYIPLYIRYNSNSLDGEATFRIAVVPDGSAGEAVAEHVAIVSGAGNLSVALTIAEPLDCEDEALCERGFTITLDHEAEILAPIYVDMDVQGVLEGDGDIAPTGVWVSVVSD